MSLVKRSASFLLIGTHVVTAMLLITVKFTRHFFTRTAENMRLSNLTEKRLENMKDSAVSDHLLQFAPLILII